MEKKVLVLTEKENNLLDSLLYFFDQEKIEYVVSNDFHSIDKQITNIIYFNVDLIDQLLFSNKNRLPIIVIEEKKQLIQEVSETVNYILTSLINDEHEYTEVQKEYLFKKGIYSVFLQKIRELLDNVDGFNHIIYDLTEIQVAPNNWIFNFESISETYAWLSRRNRLLPDNFSRKVINFYDDKVYNDSLKEINYLTEKVIDIKKHIKVIDLFVLSKDEFYKMSNNYFFKLLLKHVSNTYHLYLIDRNVLEEKEPLLLEKMLDGIAIYNDCVYRDTYRDEFSLGYVDCNLKTIQEYNEIFDYVMNTYGYLVNSESDGYGFFK